MPDRTVARTSSPAAAAEPSSPSAPVRTTRRRLLAGGAAATAVTAAGVVTAQPALAANGAAMLVGRGNSATAGTTLAASTASPVLAVTNTGAGGAAAFIAYNNNGFAGGTHSGSKWGLSAANTGTTQANGGAIAANGGVNTGMLIGTTGPNVSAIVARQAVPAPSATGNEAALLADGGNTNGVLTSTANVDLFALQASHNGSGVAVQGYSDAGIGVMGVATGGGSGLYALADDVGSYSLTADGRALFLGDVVVQGTLYAPTISPTLPSALAVGDGAAPTTASARDLARRAARTAERIRAAQAP